MMKGHVGRFCLNSYSHLLWPSICCPMNIVFRNCLARRMTSQHACVAIGPMQVRGMIVLALKCPVWASKASSSPSNHVNSCSSIASNKMNVAAYEGVSQQAGNMAAQQRIAQGIQDNGFGDGGMLLGMNMAQSINPMTAAPVQAPVPAPAPEAAAPASHTASMSVEEQVEAMEKIEGIG